MKDWKMTIWKPSRERIEPINPDSLSDAFEVADDEIERIYLNIKNS